MERLVEPFAHEIDPRTIEHRQALPIYEHAHAKILENQIIRPGFVGKTDHLAKSRAARRLDPQTQAEAPAPASQLVANTIGGRLAE